MAGLFRLGRGRLGLFLLLVAGAAQAQPVTTTMSWHPSFPLPTQLVEPSLTTDLLYDAQGRLTSVTQTDTTSHSVPYPTAGRTRTWTYGYGTGGLLTSVDGPLAGPGDTVSYGYNASGYLQTTTDEVGHVTMVTAWNGRGQPTAATDPTGTVTEYGYDPIGRLTSITLDPGPSPLIWTMTYTPAGDLATLAEPSGRALAFTWDGARRLTAIETHAGERLELTPNALSRITARVVRAPGGAVSAEETGVFDELGRLIRQVGGESRTWRFAYDKTDRLKAVTDPRSRSLAYAYDAIGRLISETERDGGVVQHGYNGRDEQTVYTDPRNLVTAYVRNGFGEVIQETSPDRGVTVLDHDARGLPITRTDARGVTASFTYDNAGRLLTRSYPSAAETVTFTYDQVTSGNKGKGRLTGVQDAAGTTSLTYDAKGRVTAEIRTIGARTSTVTYAYASTGGRLVGVTYPSGRIVNYGHDAQGRIITVGLKRSGGAPEEAVVTAAGHRPFAGVGSISFGNGVTQSWTFDREERVSGLVLSGPGGVVLTDRTYAVGDGLNLTGVTEGLAPGESQALAYDHAGRLATASGAYGSFAWSYDLVGNRLTESLASGGATVSRIYAYPAASNRLAGVSEAGTTVRSFLYDAAGIVTVDDRGGVVQGYGLDDAGRIAAVTVSGVVTASYRYDHKSRLSVREVLAPARTLHLVYDIFDRLIAEIDGTTGETVREYLWLQDWPVAVLDGTADPANPALLFAHADHLKRPERLTDGAGSTVWRALYTPFGAVHALTGPASLDLRFPGQWFQLETGLHYNWHRHYDPTTGRYTQPDPLGLIDGPSVYGYAGQSPLELTDPDGQCPWCIAVVAGSAIAAGIDVAIQVFIEDRSLSCLDWRSVGISAFFGAFGSGIGLRSTIKVAGTEWSHFIPTRYFRPNSPSYKPWLPKELIDSPLNKNAVTPERHFLHDPYRFLKGTTAQGKLPPGLQQIDRAPGWIGGAIGGGLGSASANRSER